MSSTTKPRAKQEYRDSRGVAFHEVRWMLTERPSGWPKIKRVEDPRVCALMHELYSSCWNCGTYSTWNVQIQAHHMFAGSAGRSDETCAIAILCSTCHGQEKETIVPLGRLLYLKWKHDKLHCDWTRATLLHGRWLPDLIVSKGK